MAGITTCNNWFCDIFVHRFDSDPCLVISSNISAFYRTFNFENRTINKHFASNFVNICCFVQCWQVIEVFIAYNVSCYD